MRASPAAPEAARWRVASELTGQRLDTHVAERLGAPRNRVQRWIREGRVLVDHEAATRPSQPVRSDQRIEVQIPRPAEATRLEPEPGELEVLYEDRHLVVLNKPAGLVVHPGAGRDTGTLCHRLVFHYPELAHVGNSRRPGIVHRLDAGTSGALVVARTETAYEHLSQAFAARRVGKIYVAVVHGRLRADHGEIEQPIARHPKDRKRMAIQPSGRPARTSWAVLDRADRLSLLGLRLHTGRTHQIRVHLKHLRHPIVGDPIYGEERWRELSGALRARVRSFPRPALHAWRLTLEHPITGETLDVQAEIPEDVRALWRDASGREPPRAAPGDL